MIKKVIKRNGNVVDYDKEKILNAIKKASNNSLDKIVYDCLIESIEQSLKNNTYSVEEIQDIVESALEEKGLITLLKKYIKYRTEHAGMREINNIVNTVYYSQNKDIVNENANIDGQTNTAQRDFLASESAKRWALETYLPKDIAEAHKQGVIYYHDLGFAPLGSYINCCLVNIKDMLDNGFTMGSANVTKPKSLRVACNIIAQIISAVSSQNYGGTSVNRIDEILDEYVIKSYEYYKNKYKKLGVAEDKIDELAWEDTRFEAKNSFKQLEYSINCSYNSHSQVPFVTIGFGLGETKGARLVQEYILKTRLKGLGKEGKTAVFPKLVFGLKDGLNLKPTDPNYYLKEMAMRCSAQRMYPDYLNYDKVVEFTGDYKVPMGKL